MNNIGIMKSKSRITPLHSSGTINGDIKIYRPDKNKKLKLIEVVHPEIIYDYKDLNGKKVVYDPTKHRITGMQRFKCADCLVTGERSHASKIRCDACQRLQSARLKIMQRRNTYVHY